MEYTKRRELEMVLLETARADMALRGKIAEGLILMERPELIDLFLTYQNEAIAARKFLERSLIELDSGAEILEVGGGILALGIQLASEGFKVTSVEPVGEGFTGISFIMDTFLEIARKENLSFTLIKSPIEDCKFNYIFDFIYSINVMEHLKDPYSVLLQMVTNLRKGGKYRFFCPNYDFPYEPHFAKWIFRRRNDAFFLPESRTSAGKLHLEETPGLYSSLNFLTLSKLESQARNIRGVHFNPNKLALFELLCRALNDSGLKNRHKGLSIIVSVIDALGILRLSKVLPCRYQPVMDIEINKV